MPLPTPIRLPTLPQILAGLTSSAEQSNSPLTDSLATGAAEMLGISSEDLATIQTKLQAAIAASNAMQSIQNTLQAQSAVMQGVNLAQTKLRTVAENLHTAAQGKGVIATTALTVAQWAFNAAASANPIGLLIVAIVAAIAAVWGLVKSLSSVLRSER